MTVIKGIARLTVMGQELKLGMPEQLEAEAKQEEDTLTSQLLSTMDARKWATEFVKINKGKKLNTEDMIAWFSNAIMCGHDFGVRVAMARYESSIKRSPK